MDWTGVRPRLTALLARIGRGDPGLGILLLLFLLSLPLVTPRVYAVDETEYFVYLRSLLFDGDLDFTNEYTYFARIHPQARIREALLEKRDPTTGLPLNVAPVGSALLWAPFYLLAHLGVRAGLLPGPADGYGRPYQAAVSYASTFYAFLGLVLVYRWLLRRFPRDVALAAVLTGWWGLPLLFYMYVTPPMSHANSFFAVAAFFTLWEATRGRRTRRHWLLLGFLGGLMTMVREQNLFFGVLPAVEAAFAYLRDLRGRRWRAVARRVLNHLLFSAAWALTFLPQLAAYRILTGGFRPSPHVQKKLLWTSPYALRVLLDPAHGWFLWAPLALIGVGGLFVLLRREPGLAAYALLGIAAQVYISGAFLTWSAAGSFGMRRLINVTPMVLLGVAALLNALRQRGWGWARLTPLLALFPAWNVGLIVQWAVPLMDRTGLTWPEVLVNQLWVVPRQIGGILWRFFVDRSSFYVND